MGGGGGGWSEGEITTKLSPAGAGAWAELGNSKCGLQAGTELGQAQLPAQTRLALFESCSDTSSGLTLRIKLKLDLPTGTELGKSTQNTQ